MAKRRVAVLHRTQTESYLINSKYNGPEPEVEGVILDREVRADALNWYARMGTEASEARAYVNAYLTDPKDKAQFANVPDQWLNYTTAHLMRLVTRGGLLPPKSKAFVEAGLEAMLARAVAPKPVTNGTANNVISIQDRMREKASDAVGELLGLIDDGVIVPGWSLFTYATKNEWSGMLAKRVHDKLAPIASEFLDVLTHPEDTALQEGYSDYTRKDLIALAATYQALVDDAARFADNAVKARKPRRKKVKPADQVVKKLNYAKDNAAYQLKSVHPTKIVGANELWTFNGKTNVLTVYRARTRDGLTVKGSSIVDFDVTNSSAKKMGRKAKERLGTVLTGGKVALRKVMDEFIGTPIKKIGRVNKDTVLVRVL